MSSHATHLYTVNKISCPACGAEMVPAQRGDRGVVYKCPDCSCRTVRIGVALA